MQLLQSSSFGSAKGRTRVTGQQTANGLTCMTKSFPFVSSGGVDGLFHRSNRGATLLGIMREPNIASTPVSKKSTTHISKILCKDYTTLTPISKTPMQWDRMGNICKYTKYKSILALCKDYYCPPLSWLAKKSRSGTQHPGDRHLLTQQQAGATEGFGKVGDENRHEEGEGHLRQARPLRWIRCCTAPVLHVLPLLDRNLDPL